jgi:hypothetical protein
MGDRGGRGRADVTFMVILQPVSLVRGIKSNVVVMQCKEFNEEAAVLKAGRGESCAVG